MLESKIQRSIIVYLKSKGWVVIKIIASNYNGVPDLLAIKNGRVIFFEVKQPKKYPTELQIARIRELIKSGVEAYYVTDKKQVELLCHQSKP